MLKRIRITLSTIVIILVLLQFAGSENIAEALAPIVLFLQFGPSLVQTFLVGFSVLSLGWILVLIATLLFGRVYCASFCPLGIFQDIVRHLSCKLGARATLPYQTAKKTLGYVLLLGVLLTSIAGYMLFFQLLDPFSIFGRSVSALFTPMYSTAKNNVISLADKINVSLLWPDQVQILPTGILLSILTMLLLVLVFSALRARLYCNTICPVGITLGLISRFSIVRIFNNAEKCNSCGLCEHNCPAQCIDSSQKSIDHSRCINCFNCLPTCPSGALVYGFRKAQNPEVFDSSRRNFLFRSLVSASACSSFGYLIRLNGTPRSNTDENPPIRPPGAGNSEIFLDSCTSCHLCSSVCPSKIIRTDSFFDPLGGLMLPKLDYQNGHCEFECTLCNQVCPSGALRPLSSEEKQRTQIGRAHFIRERCIVETKGKDCGACAEVCPTRSAYMLREELLFFPRVAEEHCIGCGHCENACPTDPKAIYVIGNLIHKKAKKPRGADDPRPTRKPSTEQEDFPF